MVTRERVIELLRGESAGLTAREIANRLGVEKKDINSLLYRHSTTFSQSDDHRWSLREGVAGNGAAPKENRGTEKPRSSSPLSKGAPTVTPDSAAPSCPVCGGPMRERMARQGPHSGHKFWGCTKYPECRGKRDVEEEKGEQPSAPIEPPEEVGDAPDCPACRKPMVLRRARSGSSFWGCASFPACRQTKPLNWNDGGGGDDDGANAQASWESRNCARRVIAAPVSLGHVFYLREGACLPRAVVPHADRLPEPIRRAICQWSVSLPSSIREPGATRPAWLTVSLALQRRGRLMPTDDRLASALRVMASAPATWSEQDLRGAAAQVAELDRGAPPDPGCYDSEEERDFDRDVLGLMTGSAARGWTLRQLALGSITGDPQDLASLQRVDFAVCHPRGLALVVEIDGQQHMADAAADRARRAKVEAVGFEMVRIPAEEVRNRRGPALDDLVRRLQQLRSAPTQTPLALWLLLCKRAHQLQATILEWIALGGGRGASRVSVKVELDAVIAAADREGRFTALVLDDLTDMVSAIAAARGEPESAVTFVAEPDAAAVRISFKAPTGAAENEVAYVADAFMPVPVTADLPKGAASNPRGADRVGCERLLTRLYGFEGFREGQFEAVSRAVLGLDSIVLLPTGIGKSVAFQLAALLRSGLCLVIDPILSLIDDQIDNLRAVGIDRVAQVTGNLTPQQRTAFLDLIRHGEFLFCYIAPERFQDESFRSALRVATTHSPVSLVAIDEAHCVSEWGHSFRPAYLNLARNAREYCRSAGGVPPVMALTGTASHSVLRDIRRELEIGEFDAIITPKTFDRPELKFQIQLTRSTDKHLRLEGALRGLPSFFGQDDVSFFGVAGERTHSGLVFCPFVNGDHGVHQVAGWLSGCLQRPVPYYSGKPPNGINRDTWTAQKRQTAAGFKQNHFTTMACTSAFGMGIDKPNIRYTIHFNLPPSIEAFYQEVGRAGRDGGTARCIVLCSNDDKERTRLLLDPGTSLEDVRTGCDVPRHARDDITRSLWFHLNSFAGEDQELDAVREVLALLGNLKQASEVEIEFHDGNEKLERERAIHRLLVLGVVRDYTVNFAGRSYFCVRVAGANHERALESFYCYVAAYQRQRATAAVRRARAWMDLPLADCVLKLAAEVITFVYDVIERARRRNLSEMLRLVERSSDGEQLRQGILEYLQRSQFSDQIAELTDLDDAGLFGAVAIVENVRSAIDAAEVRGEVGRALGSYPDYPGLLLLRAAAEALITRPDASLVVENARAAAGMASSKYDLSQTTVVRAAVECALAVGEDRPREANLLVRGVLQGAPDTAAAARQALSVRPRGLQSTAAGALLTQLARQLTERSER